MLYAFQISIIINYFDFVSADLSGPTKGLSLSSQRLKTSTSGQWLNSIKLAF